MISHSLITFSQSFPFITAFSHDFLRFPSFSRKIPLPKRTRWDRERLNRERCRFDIQADRERGHHGGDVSFNSIWKKYNLRRSGAGVAWRNSSGGGFASDEAAP